MSSTPRCRLLAVLLLAGCAADPEQIGEESAAIDVCGGSIQEAIDAAPAGAVLDICAGTYSERLLINGKSLTLRGTDGATTTIIDAGGLGPALIVRNTPSPGVVVRGLTLRNGMNSNAGGGLRCSDSALVVNASVIADSEADGGGGLYATGCNLTVTGTRLSNNDAGGQRGGGAWIVNSSGEIRNTRFLANSAESGGGIALTGGTLVVRNSIVRDNAAEVRGGGVYTASNASILGTTIADNTSGWTGGGVYIFRTAPTISNSTITSNTSVNDGGGFYLHQSEARLLDNTITGNLGQDDGGGIRVFESRARLERNLIENNQAGDGGGGIRLSHLRSVMIDNIVRNNTSGTTGGGIELDNDSTLVRGGVVEGNSSGEGGGIAISLAPFNGCRIERVEIRDNEANEGGGLWVADNYVYVSLRSLTVEGNRAARGAGLDIRGTNFTLHHSVFDGNIATDAGGAIAHHVRGPCDLEQCPPADPVGAIDFIVAYRNDAPFGSFLWTNKEGLSIENSIMFANIGVGVDLDGGIAEPTWGYNDMRPRSFDDMADPTGTNGNIALDPLFVDAPAGNFRLAAGSPARDAADPSLTDSDGTRADMGRYGGL
jgi:hypothetical protein